MDEDAVTSLPLRLAVSMLVVSIAVPICMQSLSDGEREISHRSAMEIAQEISGIAEELSSKPVGESRILHIGDDLRAIGPVVSILVGSLLGNESYASIQCIDASGWRMVIAVELSPVIVGLCSFDCMPLTIGCDSGNLLISHVNHAAGEIIQAGPL